MMRILFLPLIFMTACQSDTQAVPNHPPQAAQRPHTLIGADGGERHDPYYWLRERENPEVIAYLEAENAWTEAQTAHTKELQEELFAEIKGRIKQDDSSVPARKGEWYYYTRYEKGKQYPLHCRKPAGEDGPTGDEQLMLDVNQLAEGHEFFSARSLSVSPDGNLLAFATDDRGRRVYTLHIKDLRSGEMLSDVIPKMSGNLAWANDNRTLFYVKQDPQTLRDHLLYRHQLGGDPERDELVFDEQDETYNCWVYRSRSEEFLLLHSSQTITDEVRYLAADDPTGQWQVFQTRERGVEYGVDHAGGAFWIRTNWKAQNFRLMTVAAANSDAPDGGVVKTGKDHWQEFIAHRSDVLLEDVTAFKDFLVLSERENGLPRLRVRRWDGADDHAVAFDEDAYIVEVGDNREFDSGKLRYNYESMTTPDSVFEYDMATRQSKLLRQQEVLGNFDSANYRTERVWATARDGVKVPISLVYRQALSSANAQGAAAADGPRPLLLYAYGAYGSNMDPYFSPARLSLLDRGFTFAIAHVRGGQELGRHWYDDGKLLKKKNTFNDFIDCGRALVDMGRTTPEHLYAQGGSAGGLVMGVIYNQAPELWHGVVAQVPFVDLMTTMEDDSIPLTTFEYDEWGNPADLEYYNYMYSYSPYDHVEAKDYPAMLVTTGLHDSQVQYWEPAKWVARLRERKTDSNTLLMKTEMHAGHGGVSGRFRRYREVAFEYAFLLDLENRVESGVPQSP